MGNVISNVSHPQFDLGGGVIGGIAPAGGVYPLSLALTTAGRLGFYIDYSELTAASTHKFYICRTHGTSGAVSVTYTTSGDDHTSVTGSVAWADGDASIHVVDVPVTAGNLSTHDAAGLGEHRITMQLSAPTGSAVLHHESYSRAYGVIDNATMIASDANAVFYDSAAGAGTGTQASPYNNFYTAMTAMGSKRYFYGKGTSTVDSTNLGFGATYTLPVPTSRAGEATRAYVRNWPAATWTVTGTGTDKAGFYTLSGEDYHTYRGIDFSALDSSSQANGFGIFYHSGNSSGINIELCTADDINGGNANNGAYMVWGVDGAKVWRCTSNNIQKIGDNTNENTAGIFSYTGKNISVQRCEATASNSLIYHKEVGTAFDATASVRFCIDSTLVGIHFGGSGSASVPHSYTVVQGNLFKANAGIGIYHNTGVPGTNGTTNAAKHWWAGNVFDGRGAGENAAIHGRQSYEAGVFNNIMNNCRKVWADYQDTTAYGAVFEFADYNNEYGTTLTSERYEWKGVDYTTAAALFTAGGYAANDVNGDPVFTNTATNDYTLATGSASIGAGVGGTDCGIYLTKQEVIGA